MYEILEILPNGCVRIANVTGGVPAIEAGDHDRAQKFLSAEDYAKVKSKWTPEVIAFRQGQITEMEQEQSLMFV